MKENEKIEMRLCLGSSCFTRGNDKVLTTIQKYIEENSFELRTDFRGHLCEGKCNEGPNLTINGIKHGNICESSVTKVLKENFLTKE